MRGAGGTRRWAAAMAALLAAGGCNVSVPEAPLVPGDHRVNLPGVGIHYRVEGKGPVLVLHPGGPGMEWKYARMPALEKFLTVVYLDPRGAGESTRPSGSAAYGMAEYVSDLESLRVALGLGRMLLLGHSHGGMVAQSYALAHPSSLRGLILCATSPATGEEWTRDVETNLKQRHSEPWYSDAAAAFAGEEKASTDADLSALFRREVPLYFYRYEPFRERMEPVLRDLRISVEPVRQFGLEAPRFDLRSRLGEIRSPTLILAGRHDFVCGPRWAETMHAGIPGSKLVILESSGHFLYLEEEEAFARAVREFAATLPEGGGS
jgi:proline iminopeptidase